LGEIEGLRDSEDAQISSAMLRIEGLLLHAEGRFAEAAAVERRSQDLLATIHPLLEPLAWTFELHALADGGDADGLEARLAVRHQMSVVERTPDVEAQYMRFSGRLLALRGDTTAAIELLEEAAQRFAAEGMRFFEAATLVELAEAGGPVSAGAREILERLDAKPWLERLDALEDVVAVS
jgi:hypothetical protein